jgi:hypothetical protein
MKQPKVEHSLFNHWAVGRKLGHFLGSRLKKVVGCKLRTLRSVMRGKGGLAICAVFTEHA